MRCDDLCRDSMAQGTGGRITVANIVLYVVSHETKHKLADDPLFPHTRNFRSRLRRASQRASAETCTKRARHGGTGSSNGRFEGHI